VIMTRQDLLAQVAPQGKEVTEEDLQKVWSQIVLKPEIKETILSKIRMFNSGDAAAPRGLLLYGPPGTGKTEIARRIADSASCFFKAVTNADLKAGYIGQSGQAVKKVWEEARAHGRCVLFVDECDAVFGRRGSVSTDSGSEEVINEFLQSWDGFASTGQIWVIGATNQRQKLDDAIVSRFGATIEIGLPEAPERLQILALEMKKFKREADIPDFVARDTNGLAGRDLSQVARDVCTMASEKQSAITSDIWREVLGRFAKAGSDSADEGARWDSLVLAEDTIDKLKTVCESLKQIEVLKKQGIRPPRGALLYGPPGTGKTQIARTLANESGLPFIAAGPSDIKAGFIGQSGLKVRELFERARAKAPCILFIDEIESCTPSRGTHATDAFTDEIVTQMLTELDGVKKSDRHVFLLAATNHPEIVDSAILSRFVDKIEIPNPDAQQRRQLFQNMLAKQRVDFDVDQVAGELASQIGDRSGRDIYSLIERASQAALQRALKAGKADQVILSRQDLVSQLPSARGQSAD
jgi:SpoVK/Ycf46/Vps4 family AAA+-type ATPase